ncbi:UNVERIFIED_CONTAM: hypothetical protein OHV15_08310 [Microbacterium sp. SLM126]
MRVADTGGKLHDGYHFPVIKGLEHGDWPDYYFSPLTAAPALVAGAVNGSPMEPFTYWIDAVGKSA